MYNKYTVLYSNLKRPGGKTWMRQCPFLEELQFKI